MDPAFQGFERWLTANPMVRPPRETWEIYPAYRASVERIAAMRRAAPEVMAAHSTEADEVDECLMPMAQSFLCNWFASNLRSEEHTSELPSLMRISYAVFCLK